MILIMTFIFFHNNFLSQFKRLDPCFNSGENLTGLNRGDAKFVLAIHSNSGGLGIRDPIGKKIEFLKVDKKMTFNNSHFNFQAMQTSFPMAFNRCHRVVYQSVVRINALQNFMPNLCTLATRIISWLLNVVHYQRSFQIIAKEKLIQWALLRHRI